MPAADPTSSPSAATSLQIRTCRSRSGAARGKPRIRANIPAADGEQAHAASAAVTTGKSISVCATILTKFVKKFSATKATISTICASV